MKILPKMLLGFFSIVLIALLSGTYTILLTGSVEELATEIEERVYPLNRVSTNYQRATNDLWIGTYIYANGDHAMGRQYLNNGKEGMSKEREQLATFLDEQELKELEIKERNAIEASDLVVGFAQEADNSQQMKLNLNFLQQRVNALNLKLSSLVDESQEFMLHDLQQCKSGAAMTANSTMIALAISVFLGIALSLIIGRVITKPVKQLTAVANRISKGDLDVEIPQIQTKDEIHDLGESMRGVLAAVEFLTEEMNSTHA